MSTDPTATVVVVSRDRWGLAPTTLELLLARTPPQHPVVVVDGNSPPRVASAFERAAASGRARVIRHGRFLASNEARNVGAETVRTEWIAFVENDTVPSDGWVDALIEVAEARGAASAYPAYVEPGPDGPTVHGLGADLEVGDGFIREHGSDFGRRWSDLADALVPVERVQAEPHALVIRREMLDRMGGFDENLLSWFDHTDLALHHLRLGQSAWLVPGVVCEYRPPPPVTPRDLPIFALRWGTDWYERSLARLCSVWSLDPHDSEWEHHELYRRRTRRRAFGRYARVGAVVDRSSAPVDRWLARRWEARRA